MPTKERKIEWTYLAIVAIARVCIAQCCTGQFIALYCIHGATFIDKKVDLHLQLLQRRAVALGKFLKPSEKITELKNSTYFLILF